MITSLYVHIPFCNNICSYCDFPKVFSSSFSKKEYIDVLLYELDQKKINNKLKTIYIGGGTPSVLSIEELDYLLSSLEKLLDKEYEFSIEANSESLSKEKIQILKKHKINRVSLGVESTSKRKRKYLGRTHLNKDVISCVNNLYSAGIDNVNLDFIYGTKKDNKFNINRDISLVKKLNIKHVSFYSLQIEQGTMLNNNKEKTLSEDKLAKLYFYINKKLNKIGFNHYEVSNWSKIGYESKHNLVYWNDEKYYAVGLGASSYIDGSRETNTKSLTSYLKKEFNPNVEKINSKDEEFEFLMLGLRKIKGVNIQEFKSRFNKDLLLTYKNKIEKLKDYLNINLEYISIKEEYIFTMNNILLELLNFD